MIDIDRIMQNMGKCKISTEFGNFPVDFFVTKTGFWKIAKICSKMKSGLNPESFLARPKNNLVWTVESNM